MTTNMIHMTTAQQVSEHLSQVVADAVKAAGMTQRDLSDTTGIPLVTVNRKLKGHTPLNAVELVSISRAVQVSLAELALRAEQRAMSEKVPA